MQKNFIKKFKIDNFEAENFIYLEQNDLINVLEMRNKPEIRKFMYNQDIISLENHLSFVKKLSYDISKMYFLIRDGKYFLGVISLNKIDISEKKAYLGIYKNINSKISGKILIDFILKLGFEILNLSKIKLEVLETNTNAINFYKKCGFLEEKKIENYIFLDNKWQNILIMEVNKNEN